MVVFILTYLVAPLTLRLIMAGRRHSEVQVDGHNPGKALFSQKRDSIDIAPCSRSLFLSSPGIKFRTDLETYIPRHTAAYVNTLLMQEAFHSLAEIDILIEPGGNVTADTSGDPWASYPAVADFSLLLPSTPVWHQSSQ